MKGDRRELELVKAGLKDRIVDLCGQLLPDGRREGRLWVSHNPQTGDAGSHPKDPALKVALDRDIGAWTDWRSGDKGDVIGLVTHCLGMDFKAALAWSRQWLGLGAMTTPQRADFSARIERRRKDAEARAADQRQARRKAVARLWNAAGPVAADTAEALAVNRYLALGRGVPLGDVPNLDPDTFRAHPALEWWKGARWEQLDGRRRKVAPGPTFPALVSAFRAPTGQVTGVHCTFLDPLAPAKAPVASPKLMFGDTLGAPIRISDGPSCGPDGPRDPAPVILCEGVEDGLSLAIGAPEARVWACGALVHMGAAPVWLDEVETIFVAADNDWSSRQAQDQLDQVLAQLEASGKPVAIMRSAVGKDFNDGMVP